MKGRDVKKTDENLLQVKPKLFIFDCHSGESRLLLNADIN